ncbi:MAG: PIN domain-containing protein [Gemmatimonadaceae bacterium]
MPSARRYAIDTHLYIDALRTENGKDALNAFHSAFTPFIHLCSVVAHELRAGARGDAAARVDAGLIAPFERRGRVFTPSHAAWKDAGAVLAQLVAPSAWRSVTRSFVNDVLLAMACRECGVVLITDNTRDFERIARARRFDFVPAWPSP